MNLDNWTEPFKLAFKLGMFSLGWILVLIIASLVIAVSVAILKTIPSLFFGKKKQTPETVKDTLEDSYQDAMSRLAKSKNLRIIKEEE